MLEGCVFQALGAGRVCVSGISCWEGFRVGVYILRMKGQSFSKSGVGRVTGSLAKVRTHGQVMILQAVS